MSEPGVLGHSLSQHSAARLNSSISALLPSHCQQWNQPFASLDRSSTGLCVCKLCVLCTSPAALLGAPASAGSGSLAGVKVSQGRFSRRDGVGELLLSGIWTAETAYVAEQRTLGFNLQWNCLVMSFLLITRGGIYCRRGQSTKHSWTAASREVIDSLQEEMGSCLPLLTASHVLWESPQCSHGFPKTCSWVLRRVVGKKQTPLLEGFLCTE